MTEKSLEKRVGKLEDSHSKLRERFAKYDGRVVIYQMVIALLQIIIMGGLFWQQLSINSLQRDNAVIRTKLEYIEKQIGSTKKVSQYNQKLIRGEK